MSFTTAQPGLLVDKKIHAKMPSKDLAVVCAVIENQAVPTNQKESSMKAIVTLMVAALLVVGLTGCAAKATAPMKVKCPACNYEFSVPGTPSQGP